jgi:histidinol-phosphate aminotransferase
MTTRPRQSLLNPELQRPSTSTSVPRDSGVLWLDKNENLDPELLAFNHGILTALPRLALATYPEAAACYRKLSDWLGVDPAHLMLTPGSDGAIRLVFEAFVENGDAVVHTNPTFAMYPVYCQMFGARAVPVDYARTEAGPLLQSEQIIEALRQHAPKLCCLPNPDSPTGTVLAPEEVSKILAVCEELGTILLIDEAYHPFYEWTAVPWTAASRNLVVARTFAKAWGVAGLRMGYAVGHPQTMAVLHKMRPMYEVGTLAVDFMSVMLGHVPVMLESVARIKAGKASFVSAMRDLGFDVLPTHGNFVHVAFGEAGRGIHAGLSKKVLYRASFDHPSLAGYSRFSVAPEAIMTQVVDFIKQAMGKMGKRS